jgi:hypothetical protein
MDVETTEAIERLTDRIDTSTQSLRSEMQSLRGEMQSVRGEMYQRMDQLRDSLRAEFRHGLAETRRHIDVVSEQNRRHADIQVETLRGDIRILAEGFAHLSAKLDSFRPPSK